MTVFAGVMIDAVVWLNQVSKQHPVEHNVLKNLQNTSRVGGHTYYTFAMHKDIARKASQANSNNALLGRGAPMPVDGTIPPAAAFGETDEPDVSLLEHYHPKLNNVTDISTSDQLMTCTDLSTIRSDTMIIDQIRDCEFFPTDGPSSATHSASITTNLAATSPMMTADGVAFFRGVMGDTTLTFENRSTGDRMDYKQGGQMIYTFFRTN